MGAKGNENAIKTKGIPKTHPNKEPEITSRETDND
jgi:hypothetical protein